MKKSLARLDLNLLLTLQLLLQEKSVTKTAKKLNVTPSTVSKSLTKLREWFDDPLFIKSPNGFVPTPLSVSLHHDLNDWLQISRQITERRSGEVSPGMQFDLVLESPLFLTLFEQLAEKIYQQFPEAKIKARQWDYDSLEAIIKGDADIGLTGRESHPRSRESLALLPYFVDHEVLFTELPVVFMHKSHPALTQDWNLETFLAYSHINIVWEKCETWALDEVIRELGLSRRIDLTLSSFEQSLFLASQPNIQMFATAPGYCRHYVKQVHPDLVERPIPLPAEYQKSLAIPFVMLWHKRNSHNPKLIWLKENIKKIYSQSC